MHDILTRILNKYDIKVDVALCLIGVAIWDRTVLNKGEKDNH